MLILCKLSVLPVHVLEKQQGHWAEQRQFSLIHITCMWLEAANKRLYSYCTYMKFMITGIK